MIKLSAPSILALFACSFANAEKLGQWCDTPLLGMSEYDVKLELRGDTTVGFELIQTFSNGSQTIEELTRDGAQFRSITVEGKHYHLREDGALEVISEGKIDHVLDAGSYPKSTSLNEVLADSSVCY